MLTLGFDPGATGAIACLGEHGDLLWIEDMPYADGHVLAPVLADLVLKNSGRRRAVVERAQSMPGQGAGAMFKYGVGYGVILGVLGALGIPYETIRPHTWKGAAGLSKDKGASRRRACELWPDRSDLFARAKDDGRAEAALIARHRYDLDKRGAA